MSKPVMIAAALLLTPAAALTACGTDEPDRAEPATSPETTTGVPAGTERLTTQLRTADGTPVADATLDFANGFATVTVETIEDGILSPGFHGMHIHSVGECEANSVAPTGGEPGDFKSAGGHFQAPDHTGHPASGDLTSLHVRSNGAARLVTTTDMFTAEQLLADDGTALMIHQDADNFGHIPDRYTQPDGQPGPDQETLNTGDAGDRVACGVIGSESGQTTTTTTTTTTTPGTVTETEVVPAPPPATTVVPPPGAETETTTTGTTTPTTTSPTTAPESPPEQTTTPPPPGG